MSVSLEDLICKEEMPSEHMIIFGFRSPRFADTLRRRLDQDLVRRNKDVGKVRRRLDFGEPDASDQNGNGIVDAQHGNQECGKDGYESDSARSDISDITIGSEDRAKMLEEAILTESSDDDEDGASDTSVELVDGLYFKFAETPEPPLFVEEADKDCDKESSLKKEGTQSFCGCRMNKE